MEGKNNRGSYKKSHIQVSSHWFIMAPKSQSLICHDDNIWVKNKHFKCIKTKSSGKYLGLRKIKCIAYDITYQGNLWFIKVNAVKSRKLQWAGIAAKNGETNNTYRIYVKMCSNYLRPPNVSFQLS